MSKKVILGGMIIAITLSGCGWHLRGQLPLAESINVVVVDADQSNFRDLLIGAIAGLLL